MSGYYPPHQHNPPQHYNANSNPIPNPNIPNVPTMMILDGSYAHAVPESPVYGLPGQYPSFGDPSMQQAYLDQYEDVPGNMGTSQNSNARTRRRGGTSENVKHRRTRSGCYTCRQRRVKCDETHPICERCRKGQRECVYPEPHSATKSTKGSKTRERSGTDGSSPDDPEDEDSKDRLAAILDEEEDEDEEDVKMAPPLTSNHDPLRDPSDTPSLILDHSPSPSTETSSSATHPTSRPPVSRKGSIQAAKTTVPMTKLSASLPQDVRFYLTYFQEHMSPHHYSLKGDEGDFFKTDFVDMALKHEPLRYAVVGYAAYFHTLSQPDGKMSSFLGYYNESVSRLRASITRNKKQGLATFLTILQLASIEEVLGDWVNLMGHQKAAHEILTRLYTPETITQSHLLRKVLLWYIRFDLFVGFQSGGESVLGREWYVTVHDYYARKSLEEPDNLGLMYEERFSWSRLVAKDSGDLFARKAKGLLTDEDFMAQFPKISENINNLDKFIDPRLTEPNGYVTSLPGKPDPDDIVNPYEPEVIWGGERWTSNYLMLDMNGIIFMHNVSIARALRKPVDPAMTQRAYRTAQIFEAICAYPHAPGGAIIEAQATLAIATLFLPKDPKIVQWCRRTFAKIEASGYIYSNVLRNRILETWGLEPSDWWLPNDESCPRIIRSIKNFIVERTMAPKDQTSEDLREMRGFFGSLTLSDSPPSDTPIEGSLGFGAATSNPEEARIYKDDSPEGDWKHEGKIPNAKMFGSRR